LDDLAHGLGTAEDAGLLGLLEESIQRGERLIGKVEFEGPHSGSLQEKLLQQFTRVHSLRSLLSEQRLFDSNFPGSATCPRRVQSRARRPQTLVFSLVLLYHRGAQELSCTRMGCMAARKTAHGAEGPAPHSARIITCANHKGGTGKTTTAVNVSAGLAGLTQQRVLLVDCAPRGRASMALGIDRQHVRYSVTDLLTGALPEVQALCWDPDAHVHI